MRVLAIVAIVVLAVLYLRRAKTPPPSFGTSAPVIPLATPNMPKTSKIDPEYYYNPIPGGSYLLGGGTASSVGTNLRSAGNTSSRGLRPL